jgi:hypothetical protein
MNSVHPGSEARPAAGSGDAPETVAAPDPHDAPTLPGFAPVSLAAPDVPPALAHHPRYRIVEVLGSGGMGTVYKAEHQLMERPVALKVIRADLTRDPAAVERFRREVRAAARLAHRNIVTAHDADEAGGTHFLVMEFVEGTSLDRVVAREGPLPVARACDYARQAALGLQHAFERGMVHRDVKPQNLLLTPDGTVKILDFGLARFAQEAAPAGAPPARPAVGADGDGSLTAAGTLMGTPDYVAPEQAADPHAADTRSDVYALGGTLYFLLTGQVLFPRSTGLEKVMAHLEQAPPPVDRSRSDLPPGLAAVLGRMLEKDPARRYPTPADAARALEPFTHPIAVPAEGGPRKPPRRGRRLGIALGAGGGALAVAGLALLAQAGPEGNVREHLNTLFDVCAVLGGTLLGCQLLLSLLGMGHHHELGGEGHDFGGHDAGDHGAGGHDTHHGGHDSEHQAHTSWFVGLLTFRTVVVALVFFGLAGRAANAAEAEPAVSLLAALGAGAAALFVVAWMMKSLYRLRSDGTVRIDRALGCSGTVYLSIPAHKAGPGKVLLNVQNRTVEYQAVTAHEALPAGAAVTVLAVLGPDTVEVSPATSPERKQHV